MQWRLHRFNPLDRGNLYQIGLLQSRLEVFNCFNPLDQGNLYQISNFMREIDSIQSCFNPLDRGNLYQMQVLPALFRKRNQCFNPLDRGNLYQIKESLATGKSSHIVRFQSPRSGKFVSDDTVI